VLLESRLDIPVIDQTGLVKGYDYKLVLPNNVEDARKALASLGLKLVPGQHWQTHVVFEKGFKK
jgi:Protein of unknown function (DUF3738)